ncbi:hypothetical protein GUITHDRAFT_75808 [Guillardia theta CCMP2712]|uniref:Branched-chain amino acid aminotransferase n=1 Tax=Guillardia theta (strain CCMP2712) TaxID=905079 RepID=L1IWI0_GUITC|nr:hypothetical protein GUITHDRAFT_75808 [Guillardia theta CCMP2712]EKX40229.1 hypothetical protein GUITHDRAFT_75808 [Guillardia theta CCMP2712]|eukprot:XP_005827209.1 hypothetical protein GUITHDRAFT_75808 [Guillardia theta CCMP2712]
MVNDISEWSSRISTKLSACREGELIKAFYSSLTGAITTNSALASVPMDDHLCHRGHAVFDTCTLAKGRIYRLRTHIDRFLASAHGARIDPPLSRSEIENIILHTAAASGLKDGSVRFWLSAGPGDFSIVPKQGSSSFYCVIFVGSALQHEMGKAPPAISEVTVRDVPLKPPALSSIKTNNYLLNSLTALRARDLGGTFGILVDEEGFIAESCVLNVSFVLPDKTLVTPTFARALNGTTVRKCLEFAEPKLIAEGLIKEAQQRPIAEEEAHTAVEIFLTGGDLHLYAVTSWDGEPVGDGQVGPVATRLLSALEDEAMHGSSEHLQVPYS